MLTHNLISHNQLEGWRESVHEMNQTLDKRIEELELINDYYECLISCHDNQSICKRICREVLRSPPI